MCQHVVHLSTDCDFFRSLGMSDLSDASAVASTKCESDANFSSLPKYNKYAKGNSFQVVSEADASRAADELFLKRMYAIESSAELPVQGVETLSINHMQGDGFWQTYSSKIMHTNTVDDNMYKMIVNIALSAWCQIQHDTCLREKLKSKYMLRTFFDTPFHLRTAIGKLINFDIQLCPVSLFSSSKMQLLNDIDIGDQDSSYFILVAVGLDNGQSTFKITTAPFDHTLMFGSKQTVVNIHDSVMIRSDISSRGRCKHCQAETDMLCPLCKYTYFCSGKCYKSKIKGHKQAVCARIIDIMNRSE